MFCASLVQRCQASTPHLAESGPSGHPPSQWRTASTLPGQQEWSPTVGWGLMVFAFAVCAVVVGVCERKVFMVGWGLMVFALAVALALTVAIELILSILRSVPRDSQGSGSQASSKVRMAISGSMLASVVGIDFTPSRRLLSSSTRVLLFSPYLIESRYLAQIHTRNRTFLIAGKPVAGVWDIYHIGLRVFRVVF